jgi:hypothetical protein
VRIAIAPGDRKPFQVDAEALEEDTFLVLSADPEVRDPKEHPVRLMTDVWDMKPVEPGSVIAKGRRPLRLLAIVHDLNQEPTWREEWVKVALDGIFQEVESRELKSLSLPLLGTIHGHMDQKRFVHMLVEALQKKPPIHLKRLWLVVHVEPSNEIIELLKSELEN